MENWKTYKLGDIVDQKRGISYGIVQPGQNDPDGIPIIKVNNLTSRDFNLNHLQKVSKSIDQNYSRTRLQGGELLLSLVGTLGEVFLVPENLIGHNVVRALAVIPILEEYSPSWVMYWLRSSNTQNTLKQIATTSVQATINLKELREIIIPFPDKNERLAIASILSALDDKIELNLQMNKTLEEMAMALYKHWFVDFGPFQEGEFVDSELGRIPEGWEVRSAYSLANFINGAAFKSRDFLNDKSNGLPIIKIVEIKNGITDQTMFSDKTLDEKYIIQNSDILFPWSGNPHTSLGIYLWDKGRALLNQHIFVVRVPNLNNKSFVFNCLKYLLPTFINLATHKQTTGLGHVTVSNLKDLKVVVPDINGLTKYNEIALPLMEMLFENQIENQTLTTLRDTLLPKLISGVIRVKDSEKILADVL